MYVFVLRILLLENSAAKWPKTISGETALAVSILLCQQGLLEARAGGSTRGADD